MTPKEKSLEIREKLSGLWYGNKYEKLLAYQKHYVDMSAIFMCTEFSNYLFDLEDSSIVNGAQQYWEEVKTTILKQL